MATIKGVYEELKKMKKKGEDIGMFGESFIEMYEKDQESSTTKEVHVTFVKNKKEGGSNGKNNFISHNCSTFNSNANLLFLSKKS